MLLNYYITLLRLFTQKLTLSEQPLFNYITIFIMLYVRLRVFHDSEKCVVY